MSISDYFSHGIWEEIKSIQDPGLKERAHLLPNILQARWADSTKTKYEKAWEKWVKWCQAYPESPKLPAQPFYIALYINDMVLENCKYGALEAAALGIRYGHVIAGFENPLDDLFIKAMLEGAKRTIGKATVKRQKEPVTTDIMREVVDRYGGNGNLLELRFVITCLVGFAGFLRISELQEIRVRDLTFDGDCMKILIPKSKNDQVREGHVVYISRSGGRYCVVAWVERYLSETKLGKDPDSFLMCRLAKTRMGHNALGNRSISKTTINDDFHKFMRPLCKNLSSESYGLHSLRSGGASAAINNGVSERLVGKHGRWKSGYSRDRYLKDDKKGRLSVTKAINL